MISNIWNSIWPSANASAEELMRWRTIMSVMMLTLILHAISSYTTFARAQDMKSVQIAQLESEIWAAQKERCVTPVGTRLREILANRITELLTKYYVIAEKPYDLPACVEFGGA